MSHLHSRLQDWFSGRGWKPFSFQEEVWAHYESSKSGLLHAPTGFGKTLSHNLALIRGLPDLRRALGVRVLLGASRKSLFSIEMACGRMHGLNISAMSEVVQINQGRKE